MRNLELPASIEHVRAVCTALAIVAAVSGCDLIADLRKAFHPEEEDAGEFGKAGLRVEVDPPVGISILLDGVRVSSMSPFMNKKLKAGVHRLEVRAMGYHAVAMPVELEDNELVTVPVTLRERAPDEPEPEPPPPPDNSRRDPPPPPPDGPAPPLPSGVNAITLTVAPDPKVPVLLDNTLGGRQLILERVHGKIIIGVMNLRYRIGGAGLLTIQVADDKATWLRHNKKLKRGASFKLHRGVVRLRRRAADGTDQTVLLRR